MCIRDRSKKFDRPEMSISAWFQNKRYREGLTLTKASKVTRTRTKITDFEKRHLENFFMETQYPTIHQRRELAKKTQLHEKSVTFWFRNRRCKHSISL